MPRRRRRTAASDEDEDEQPRGIVRTEGMALQEDALCELQKAIGSLYNKTRYSDLTVRCKTRNIKVHQLIVCTQDAFFKRAVDFKIKQGQDPRDVHVDLQEDNEKAVEGLLYYLYTHECKTTQDTTKEDLSVQCGIVALAEEHQLESLSNMAKYNVRNLLEEFIGNMYSPSYPDFSNLPAELSVILQMTYSDATTDYDYLISRSFEILVNTPSLFDHKEIREAIRIIQKSESGKLKVVKRDLEVYETLMKRFDDEINKYGVVTSEFRDAVVVQMLRSITFFPRPIAYRGKQFGSPW